MTDEVNPNEIAKRVNFNHKKASVRLMIWSDGVARVSSFISREPRQGHGAEVFKKMLTYADKHNLTLFLVANSYTTTPGVMNNKQLISFYESYGFVKVNDGKKPVMMWRIIC